jgi:ATP-dependent Clp protease adaptor protein ClpS
MALARLGHWTMAEGLTAILTQTRASFVPSGFCLTMAGRGRPGERGGDDGRTDLVTKTRPKTKKPSLYKVLLLNDDYTPQEFVVLVLEKFFGKGQDEAYRIMMHVHQKGVGVCGVFTYEVAETKVTQVMDFARQNGHPLQCTMEKE